MSSDSNEEPAVSESDSDEYNSSSSSNSHMATMCRYYRNLNLDSDPIGISPETMTKYLNENPEFLEWYIYHHVSIDTVKNWLIHMDQHNLQVGHVFRDFPCKTEIYSQMINNLSGTDEERGSVWEVVSSLSTVIGVDAFRLYKIHPDEPRLNIVQYYEHGDNQSRHDPPSKLLQHDPDDSNNLLEVAEAKKIMYLTVRDDKFPTWLPTELFRHFDIMDTVHTDHVMYVPLLNDAVKTIYIVEMWRLTQPFTFTEQEICVNFTIWGSLSINYCVKYNIHNRDNGMSGFLKEVTSSVFEEMVSLDQLIKRILQFTQRLVNADRSSLFLVDTKNNELVSTVFDLRYDPFNENTMDKKEIRMPMNKGIAGIVAMTGIPVITDDAYTDSRFNRDVDEATGYHTNSILCMPVKVEGKVIGVVQMVNKRNRDNPYFAQEDQESFGTFTTLFGLALHNAKLYDRILRKEHKYRVALEVLSYHNTCREAEVEALLSDKKFLDVHLEDYFLDPFSLDDDQKCKSVIWMFHDLFKSTDFDDFIIARFILTVRKNYRTVPYHNFDHGWSVAHCIYVMLKKDTQKKFKSNERFAMFVAALCHDLDHRGYTNKYMNESASPLASMYSTSTLEHHHFNITVTILQQEGHNILSHVNGDEYKEILGLIKYCILATDLAVFFTNLAKMETLCSEDEITFDWKIPEHRYHRRLVVILCCIMCVFSCECLPYSKVCR